MLKIRSYSALGCRISIAKPILRGMYWSIKNVDDNDVKLSISHFLSRRSSMRNSVLISSFMYGRCKSDTIFFWSLCVCGRVLRHRIDMSDGWTPIHWIDGTARLSDNCARFWKIKKSKIQKMVLLLNNNDWLLQVIHIYKYKISQCHEDLHQLMQTLVSYIHPIIF